MESFFLTFILDFYVMCSKFVRFWRASLTATNAEDCYHSLTAELSHWQSCWWFCEFEAKISGGWARFREWADTSLSATSVATNRANLSPDEYLIFMTFRPRSNVFERIHLSHMSRKFSRQRKTEKITVLFWRGKNLSWIFFFL